MRSSSWCYLALCGLLLLGVSLGSQLDPNDYDYYREVDGAIPSNTVVIEGHVEVVEGLPVSALNLNGIESATATTIATSLPASAPVADSTNNSTATNSSGPGYDEHIAHMFVLMNHMSNGTVESTSRYELDFSAFADQTSPGFPRTYLRSDDTVRLEVVLTNDTFPARAQVFAVGLIARLAAVEDGIDPVYTAKPTSELKVLWVLMNFKDASSVCTRSQVESMVFSGSPNMVEMYQTVSNGRQTLEKQSNYASYHVAGPYNFPQFSISQDCNTYVYQWQTAAAQAAYNAGYDLSKYGTLAMVVPRIPTCYWAGLASLSSSCAPYTTSASTKPRCFAALNYCLAFAFMHELGHNLYMHHSATDTADGTTYTSNNEYTDWSCVMGNQNSWNNFNAPKLYAKGWLDTDKVLIDTPGVVTLSTTDMPSANAQYPQMVVINVPSTNKHYYLSFRTKQNSGRWLSTKYSSTLNIHYTIDTSQVSRYVTSIGVGGSYLLKGVNWRVVVNSISGNNMQITIFPCDSTSSCSSYAWSTSSWSSCSATCGTGTQTRSVTCVDTSNNNAQVDNSFCSASQRPANSQSCNTQSCAVPAWVAGSWGSCSSACGGGQRTRSVTCVLNGANQPDSVCSSVSSKPATSEACGTNACYGWTTGSWSSCSAVCGVGTQNRDVVCSQLDANSQPVANVAESLCVTSLKPGAIRNCDAGPCAYGWYAGGWSRCSAACAGTATRTVECRQQGATTAVAASLCVATDRPASSKSCGAPKCCDEGFAGPTCQLRAFSVRMGPLSGLDSSAVLDNGESGWNQFSSALSSDIASALSISADRVQTLNFDAAEVDKSFVEFALIARPESEYPGPQSVMPDVADPMSYADLLSLYGGLQAQALNRNSALYSGAVTSHLVFSAVAPNDPSDNPGAPPSGSSSSDSASTVGVAVGVSVGGAALVALTVASVYLFKRRRQQESISTTPASEVELRAGSVTPQQQQA